MMKLKTILFFTIFLISLLSISVSDGQTSADEFPPGVIQQFKHGAAVYAVAYSPHGEFIASGGDNNVVILWNVADRKKLKTFTGPSDSVMSVAFSPDGKHLASASLDGFVRLYNVALKSRIDDFVHGGWVNSIAFSPDGKMLVSGGEVRDEAVKLWDVDASQNHLIASFPGHNNTVESVTFSSDGKYLASTSRDNTVKIWDVPSQQLQSNLTKHKNIVYSVAFSSDGQRLATSSRDYTIKLWNLSTGENIDIFKAAPDRRVQSESLAFSPDGKHLAAACSDNHIRLWNVDNHHNVTTLRGHTDSVFSVCFSSDGRQLVSGSRDRTVLLWDLAYFNIVPSLPDPTPKPDQVIADITPPDITILTPSGRIVPPETEELTVRGRVSDDSSIGKLNVNGKEVEIEADGRFYAFILLSRGNNEVRVTATDLHGNMGAKQFVVERPGPVDKDPPIILLDDSIKTWQESQNSEFSVIGSVIDDNNIDKIQVNGNDISASWEGKFTVPIDLVKGRNEVRVTATDTHGNMSTRHFTVFVPNPGPKIHIIEPSISSLDVSISRGLKRVFTIADPYTTISGEVEDDDGVSEVTVNDKTVNLKGKMFKSDVPLTYGDNSIHVTATDKLDKQAVRKILIYRPLPTRKDYALLFAVDQYDHWTNLRYPISDAEKIQQYLTNIYGFQTELIKNPSKEDIYNTILRYAEKTYDNDDQLFIFFAGHGYFNGSFKEGLLVAQDTKLPANDPAMVSFVSFLRLSDVIDRMNCKHIFLVMDSCYSGTIDSDLAMRGFVDISSKELSQEYIRQISEHTTRRYLTSGQNEQVPDNSKFIHAFITALQSNGGNDKILNIDEILSYMGHLQNPKPHANGFGEDEPEGDFLFFAK